MDDIVAVKKKNILVRLLNGDIKLVYTYWIFGVAINLCLTLVTKYIELNYIALTMLESGALAIQIFVWMSVAILTFLYISIWNSATKYQGPSIWKICAKILAVLASLNLVNTYFFTSDSDQRQNDMILAQAQLPYMIDAETRADWMEIEGRFYSYKFTLIDFNAEDIDADDFLENLNSNLRLSLCSEKGTLDILQAGYGIKYHYSGVEGVEIGQVTFPADLCE